LDSTPTAGEPHGLDAAKFEGEPLGLDARTGEPEDSTPIKSSMFYQE